MTEYLTLHIANLSEHRWVRKVLAWNPSIHLFDADLWKGLAPCARIMPPIYRTPNGTTTRCHRVTAGQPLFGRCLGWFAMQIYNLYNRRKCSGGWSTTTMQTDVRKNMYGILQWNFDAGGVRVEVGLAVVVSLRPRGVAFGQASSIQRDRIMIHIFAASPLSLAITKATNYLTFIGPRGGKAPVVLRYGVIISSC